MQMDNLLIEDRDTKPPERFSKPLVTEIRKATPFYLAEDHHQDYYKKRSWRYKLYRYNSGRDQFLKKAWKKEEADND